MSKKEEAAYQIVATRKNSATLVSISSAPIKEVYAMIHAIIDTTIKKTGQSFDEAISTLADLNKFLIATGQVEGDADSYGHI